MQEILERVRKAVVNFDQQQPGSHMKTMKALLSAMSACRKYIDEQSQTDRGVAQRLARELDEILVALPDFRQFAGDKAAMNARHTKKLAEEHLDEIEKYLKGVVDQERVEKKNELREWVNAHPVFGELRKKCSGKLPKTAYVLLFRAMPGDSLELVLRSANEKQVLTRFRPHEFLDDARVQKAFGRGRPVVGAAVIAERQLVGIIGVVPPPSEKQDQLQVLLAVSKQAAGKPAVDFIQRNEVLRELHQLCRRRKVPKDAYILLFSEDMEAPSLQASEANGGQTSLDSAEPGVELSEMNGTGHAAAPKQSASEHAGDNGAQMAPAGDEAGDEAVHEQSESSGAAAVGEPSQHSGEHEHGAGAGSEDDTISDGSNAAGLGAGEENGVEPSDAAEPTASQLATDDVSPGAEPESESASNGVSAHLHAAEGDVSGAEEGEHESEEDADAEGESESDGEEDSEESGKREPAKIVENPKPVRIVTRTSHDGKVLTRFWSPDFAVKHKIFEAFRAQPAIIGAAIVKKNELIRAFGHLPRPSGNRNQFSAIMSASKSAVEQPSLDFVAENEVLKGLHDLANKHDFPHREAYVLLFSQNQEGRVDVVSLDRIGARIPLHEFQYAKAVHDRFAPLPAVIGASVISGGAPPKGRFGRPDDHRHKGGDRSKPGDKKGGGDRKGGFDGDRRGESGGSGSKPSVVAAFGRTPLKLNHLATPENFVRLGLRI